MEHNVNVNVIVPDKLNSMISLNMQLIISIKFDNRRRRRLANTTGVWIWKNINDLTEKTKLSVYHTVHNNKPTNFIGNTLNQLKLASHTRN